MTAPVAIRVATPAATTNSQEQQQLETFYRALELRAKNPRSWNPCWNPLGSDLRRHIYTFLPIETVTEIPTLASDFAVQAYRHHTVARELIRRSSPECPLTFEQYRFCEQDGEMGIRHLSLNWRELTCKRSSKLLSNAWIEVFTSVIKLKDSLESLKIPSFLFDGFARTYHGMEFPTFLNMKQLDLSLCVWVGDKSLKDIVSRCPHLTHLTLPRHGRTTREGFEALAPFCQNLTHLSCSFSKDMTEEGLKVLAPKCGNLTYLDLQGCNITDAGLIALAPYGGKLTYLDLRGSPNITDAGLKALAPYCENLTHFTLPVGVTDEGLKDLVSICKKLTYLDALGCTNITNEGIVDLISHSPDLIHLNLGISSITDAGLKAIAPYCRKLVYLDLSFLNVAEGIKDIAPSCPDLKYLDLTGCSGLADESLQVIASSCKKLESLKLLSCSGRLTDESLKAIARSCPDLKYLETTEKIFRSRDEINRFLLNDHLVGPPAPLAPSLWLRIQAAIEHIFQNFG